MAMTRLDGMLPRVAENVVAATRTPHPSRGLVNQRSSGDEGERDTTIVLPTSAREEC